MSRALLDGASDGTIVSDDRGRIIYANKAYSDICGMSTPDKIRSLEGLLNAEPEASEPLERLTSSLRSGVSGVEEFRLSHNLSSSRNGTGSWYRVRARPLRLSDTGQQLSIWQISDISNERAEQERFFRDLQLAIDHLDQAPRPDSCQPMPTGQLPMSMRRWLIGSALILGLSAQVRWTCPT